MTSMLFKIITGTEGASSGETLKAAKTIYPHIFDKPREAEHSTKHRKKKIR